LLRARSAWLGSPRERPRAARVASARGRLLDRIRYRLSRRWAITVACVFCVALFLLSDLPSSIRSPPAGPGLDNSQVGSSTPTFYPYLTNTSLYSPASVILAACGSVIAPYPQLATAVVNQVPEYFLLYGQGSYTGTLDFETGSYSPSDAQGWLNGTGTTAVPIQWNNATAVTTWTIRPVQIPPPPVQTPLTGDALATASDGSVIFAAIAEGAQTSVFESLAPSYGSSWTSMLKSPISAMDPRLAYGGSDALLTTITGSVVYATTLYPHGSPDYYTDAINLGSPVLQAAPFWTSDSAGGEEGFVATTESGSVVVEHSTDGGYTFLSDNAGIFQPQNLSTPFRSVGSTGTLDSLGSPGQLEVTAAGTSVFALVSTGSSAGAVPESFASSNGGLNWSGPHITNLSRGSFADPMVVPSEAGYVYAGWLSDAEGSLGVQEAAYSLDGRLIQSPGDLPGSFGGTSAYPNTTAVPPVVAVDAFQRPLAVWSTNDTSCVTGTELRASGAFLSPQAALSSLTNHLAELQPWDFRNAVQGVGKWTLVGNVTTRIAWANANLTRYQSTHSVTYLCNLQNLLADAIYPNVTHIEFHYGSGLPSCANFAFSLKVTNSTGPNGAPLTPPNFYWTPSVAMTLGPLSANTYLGVVTDWALEGAGVSVTFRADPLRSFVPTSNVLPPIPSLYQGTVSAPGPGAPSGSETVTVDAAPTNPTTGLLAVTGSPPPTYSTNWSGSTVECTKNGVKFWITIQYTENAWAYQTYSNVSVDGGGVHSYKGGASNPPSIYVTNLTSNATFPWYGNFTYDYEATITEQACMTTSSTSAPPGNGIPASITVPVAGVIVTSLRMLPNPLTLVNLKGQNTVWAYWNNTMPAKSWMNSTNQSCTGSGCWKTNSQPTSPGFAISAGYQSPGLGIGDWYWTSLASVSELGGYNATQTPPYNANRMLSSAPAHTGWVCDWQFTTNPITDSGFGVTNLTGGNATVQWNSTVNSSSWVRYYEFGIGVNFTQTAQVKPVSTHWEYFVELHGLSRNSIYKINGITAQSSGCLTHEGVNSTAITTMGALHLAEFDYPYDSISRTGGGAAITYTLPSNITKFAAFSSGYLVYSNLSNTSQTFVVPVTGVSPLYSGSDTYVVNLTGLSLNVSYSVTLTLNYTLTAHWMQSLPAFTSPPLQFTYGKDSSGDGLTNAEKTRGWFVPVPNPNGSICAFYGWSCPSGDFVPASPASWATNGLVSDFVEKEFDLDPQTIDTARSHMLDTWNLTFDIGTSNICPTTYFKCWNESSKTTGMNPFNFAQYPGGSHSGKPNTTWIPPNRYPLDDGSQYDAYHLWSGTGTGNALSYLEGLVSSEGVGWLRAVLGYYPASGHYTLTVWGKLSWGANPLARSTPGTGVADGSRVIPLGGSDLQVSITSWANPGLSSSVGVAAFINAAYSGTKDYANYTKQLPGNSAYAGTFVVTFPVNASNQYVNLNVSLEKHTSSGLSQILNSATLTVDLENLSLQSYSTTGGTLKFSYQAVPVFAKAPTFVYVPTDNSTLSSLPLGLQRYTGEQNFVLLVVNDTVSGSNTLTVSSIPYSDNSSSGAYAVSLSGGLNNILVPRGAFINSPLGQALLNTTNQSVTWTSRNAAFQSDWANVALNGAEWYDRIVGTKPNTNYLPTHWQMNVTSNISSQNTSNPALAGGVPENPALEQNYQTRAIQAIFTLNISQSPDLQGMLAGLILNKSGNFTGWLYGATSELPTLGLLPAVSNALANSTYRNDGAYGAPTYSGSQNNPPGWWIFGGGSWNIVSGIITGLKLIAMVWTAAIAAMAYFGELYVKAILWGLQKIQQIPSVLRSVSMVIRASIETLVNEIVNAAKQLLSSLLSPVEATLSRIASVLGAATDSSMNAMVSYSSGQESYNQSYETFYAPFQNLSAIFSMGSGIQQAMTSVTNALQPILNLFDPLWLMQQIGDVFGFTGSRGLIGTITGAATWVAGQAIGFVFNILENVLRAVGLAGSQLTPPAGTTLPSTSQMQFSVNGYQSVTGDSTVPNLVNPMLTSSTTANSIPDYIQFIIDVILTVVAGAAVRTAIATNLLSAIGGDPFVSLPRILDLLTAVPWSEFFFQIAGLLLDTAGFLTSNSFFKFEFAAVGGALILFSFLDAQFTHKFFRNSKSTPATLIGETLLSGFGLAVTVTDMCTAVNAAC
jgi:hypothetical protein